MKNITIIGAGAWGSAFGKALRLNGHAVRFLDIGDTAWPADGPGDCVILAVPCQAVRKVLNLYPSPSAPVFSLIKGIELSTHQLVSEIVREVWRKDDVGAVSGPSLAAEVQAGVPTVVVVAAASEPLAVTMQKIVHGKVFRAYRSTDLTGVELGGALKNVYALAGGICQGLRLGENTMAALMTRALAEMARIAAAKGARAATIYGLSGMGDLLLTAYSPESRNHKVGEALGRGRELPEILRNLAGTAEGVPTVKALHELAQGQKINAPIVSELYQILYCRKPPAQGLRTLMQRKAELE
ncbi:MAG: NAD(P)H-dependent glycerol-3-phosphate dehydrogenase [Verrucomicrobiales bacterium]|jgi:glycerol-3-phosphate dehydrogenase (NAD(P)+)|nr:NAD(P)H-dependent glycerol-3-phosphate dehydrogenase [Verrucomicrobiales bacterium]